MSREILFRIFATVFLAAAAYHAAACLHPAFSLGGSPARHAAFAVIDAMCAWGLLCRPRWFVVVFGALTAEAIWSHGKRAWILLEAEQRIDWISLLVVLLVPCVLVFLIKDAVDRRRN
jgi:hypothetical protein